MENFFAKWMTVSPYKYSDLCSYLCFKYFISCFNCFNYEAVTVYLKTLEKNPVELTVPISKPCNNPKMCFTAHSITFLNHDSTENAIPLTFFHKGRNCNTDRIVGISDVLLSSGHILICY